MTDDGDDVWRSVDGSIRKDPSQRYHKYLDVTLEDAKLDISMQFSDDGSINQNHNSSSGSPLRIAVTPSPQVDIYMYDIYPEQEQVNFTYSLPNPIMTTLP